VHANCHSVADGEVILSVSTFDVLNIDDSVPNIIERIFIKETRRMSSTVQLFRSLKPKQKPSKMMMDLLLWRE